MAEDFDAMEVCCERVVTCGLLVIILQFQFSKEKNIETQKEYSLRYLLAKVRTT
jgi:predicted metal-binding transcription factor (methanogenesis marker protein 9)